MDLVLPDLSSAFFFIPADAGLAFGAVVTLSVGQIVLLADVALEIIFSVWLSCDYELIAAHWAFQSALFGFLPGFGLLISDSYLLGAGDADL